jgi:hypothetical protein
MARRLASRRRQGSSTRVADSTPRANYAFSQKFEWVKSWYESVMFPEPLLPPVLEATACVLRPWLPDDVAMLRDAFDDLRSLSSQRDRRSTATRMPRNSLPGSGALRSTQRRSRRRSFHLTRNCRWGWPRRCLPRPPGGKRRWASTSWTGTTFAPTWTRTKPCSSSLARRSATPARCANGIRRSQPARTGPHRPSRETTSDGRRDRLSSCRRTQPDRSGDPNCAARATHRPAMLAESPLAPGHDGLEIRAERDAVNGAGHARRRAKAGLRRRDGELLPYASSGHACAAAALTDQAAPPPLSR